MRTRVKVKSFYTSPGERDGECWIMRQRGQFNRFAFISYIYFQLKGVDMVEYHKMSTLRPLAAQRKIAAQRLASGDAGRPDANPT